MHSPLQATQPQQAAQLRQSTLNQDLGSSTMPLSFNHQPHTVDELMRHRSAFYPNEQAISYPRHGVEFVHYTFRQLDVFAWRVAQLYSNFIPVRERSSETPRVVALLGPSNFEYLISLLAVAKLGHTALLLSTRIPQAAIESLTQATGAETLIADSKHLAVANDAVARSSRVNVRELAKQSAFEFAIDLHGDTSMTGHLDAKIKENHTSFIIHSSGSTGLPKPILQTQKACLANYAVSMNMKGLVTLPLYHNHGICNLFRAIYCRKPLYLYNAELPLTSSHLVRVFRENNFEIFYGVPYALKLLAESEEGIHLLRQLKVVMYGGSACPDDLGNKLVKNGVNLVSHYGATEVGQLMTSFRPDGDKEWNYVREQENLSPFLKWIPRAPNLFECCVLDGWPSKVQSNQPDQSYCTKDLFQPHHTIPKAWKYIARLDDTIVLVNGEKFNPVATEGTIRSHKLVKEAAVYGTGRPYLGILIVPASELETISHQEAMDALWPLVEAANHSHDAFAKISKEMVTILPSNCDYPRTDKGSIIRQAFYRAFKDNIDDAYDSADKDNGSTRTFNNDQLKAFLRMEILQMLADKTETLEDVTDLFLLGLDSLQAIQLRSTILRSVDIGSKTLIENVVFEYPSIEKLSNYLQSLQSGEALTSRQPVEVEMGNLIEKYKISSQPATSSVVVTGATGSLGAHIVAKLAQNPNVSKIWCLVRGNDDNSAESRVQSSLKQRRLLSELFPNSQSKIIALAADLSNPTLGLTAERYAEIRQGLSAIIHCAWSVNFSMHLSSFEKGNVAGVSHLLRLCQASSGQATMNFCSSVSTCSRATVQPIPESLPELEWAQGMGYAQSKSVAEHLCAEAAAQGVITRVLRVGQICGDTQHGIWNAQEAIPMMMQTALTVGALPKLSETPSWLPVDVVAQAVIDISLSKAGSLFANVVNPQTFSWTGDFIPALQMAGLDFDLVEPREWVARLRRSDPDPTRNPPVKLVEFFASKYDTDSPGTSKEFATDVALEWSPILADTPALTQDLVDKYIRYFKTECWLHK